MLALGCITQLLGLTSLLVIFFKGKKLAGSYHALAIRSNYVYVYALSVHIITLVLNAYVCMISVNAHADVRMCNCGCMRAMKMQVYNCIY